MVLLELGNDSRQLLIFFSLCGLFGGLSGLSVKYRQLQLRFKSLSRFRKTSDSDESNHTLIDMKYNS